MTIPKQAKEPMPGYGQLPPGADASFKGSFAAIQRAAVRARRVAQQSGTDLIVARAGRVVRVSPQQKDKP